ncbi:uncharacterized protein LOC123886414 [Trifolium pratense]|uniref:uncharacterized protein LOC123886414 n=1 Tax=Trifolium pratense TaxID=57577 RepID=UPI001E691ADE|nr:uncharacterized protein LOC123886414 [Trifolium pratense]
MASFLCELVKKYVDKLIDGAIEKARYVFCFTCIVKQFEEERTTLEPQRITIEQRVKDARERDKDIQANVVSWEKDIDELNQVDTKTKQTCFFGFCPNCIRRYKKGEDLSKKLEKIKQLKGEKFENIELPRPVPGVERYSSKDYISFESRESKYKELLDALKDDNNYITGLQGMGGTGKTTMAKEVGKELKQSEIFAYVVDTTVSFTPDIKKIQDDIAGSLRLEWGGCNEPDRPKKLWSRLTNGDKILVILDDVWDRGPPLDFDAIGIPKQDTHKGCRVLVTSRNQETFNNMDCDKIIELGLLSEEEAWIMFKMYAKISDSTSQKLIDKGRKIAKECKRLPVAISVIASSLKGHQHREHKWDVTLKSLKKPVSMHGVDDDKVGIYNCLKISYDNLKDEIAKGLFLLCSVFREDEENSIEVITRLCIGVGLLGEDYGSYDDARNLVVLAKDKLVDSCLLLEDGEKRLKLHDLVREAAQWIANKDIQCVKLFDKNEKSSVEKQTNIKYLLCEGKRMDIFNLKFDGSKLEALIIKADTDHGCTEVPKSFFENVIKLRVLNFSGNYYDSPLSLPDSIRSLTNIRSMLVDNVDLGDISILGNLQSLETLDLDRCKVNELPNQITELNKFKLLKLEDCEIRKNNPFEVIKRCSSLEELYFKYSFNDFCQEITLPELQRYHIKNHTRDLELVSTRFSKYVVFRGDEKCQFSKGTLKYCMQTAEALCLEGIKGEWRNLMPEIVPLEHGMNDLVELHLDGISQLRCLIDTIGSHVPILSNLVVLELKNMKNLEQLFNGKANLCNLKSIKVENCPMLVSILSFLSAQDLPALEAIRIRECDGLKYVFGQSQHVELVSLTKLELSELPNFISIFEECVNGSSSTSKAQIQLDQPHDCSVASESNSYGLNIWERLQIQSNILCNIKEIVLTHFPKMKSVFILSIDLIMQLETLTIKNCDELKHIIIDIGYHNIGGNICVNVFPKLKELYVVDCAQLEYIFGHDTSSDHQNDMGIQLHLPELRKLHLTSLPSLIAMCPKQYRITFPSLKSLRLCECSQYNTIIKELSGNIDLFLTLETLDVFNSNVESIFSLNEIDEQQLDLALRYITLIDLPMMTCLFVGPKNSFSLKNLTRITIMRCDKLKIAFSTSILRFLPQLRILRIEECNELEHIIEDDLENKNISTTCFPKLEQLAVRKCNKLKFVFSTSMLRFLPQLRSLIIEECKELEHIIEDHDGLENKQNSNSLSSTTFFPELKGLGVIKCNKLKSLFPFSVCKELPKLNVLLIREANELEEIFKSADDQNVHIPNLNILAFDMLPSLSDVQGNQFQAVKSRIVRNCDKILTLTSASTTNTLSEIRHLLRIIRNITDYRIYSNVKSLFEQQSSAEATEDFEISSVENVQDLTILPTNSKEMLNEQSIDEQHSHGENNIVVKPSQVNDLIYILSFSSHFPCILLTLFRMYELNYTLNINILLNFKQGIEIEGTSKTNNDQVSLNGDALMKVNSYVEEQFFKDDEIIVSKSEPSPRITSPVASKGDPSQKLEDLLPTNSKIQMKQTPKAEHEFVKNVMDLAILPTNSEELLNEQSLGETDTIIKPSQVNNLDGSTSEKTPIATMSTISGTKNEPPIQVVASKQKGIEVEIEGVSKTNNDQVSSNGDAFIKVNSNVARSKPSFPSITSPIATQGDPFLVKRELEELASKNHLDYENMSLLTDFLVRNPSVRLKDTSLGDIYKGCAYNFLAKLLKFLETHSLLEVSGSSHSEFVELLQVVRNFAFDKEWLVGVERRVLFPEIQVSQDAFEKLLDSKKRVAKDVEDLRLKIDFLSQVAEDLKHQLTSSEAVLENIIQQEAILSAPIGY